MRSRMTALVRLFILGASLIGIALPRAAQADTVLTVNTVDDGVCDNLGEGSPTAGLTQIHLRMPTTTLTPTPTPEPPTITALQNTTCRFGPDPFFKEEGYLLQGNRRSSMARIALKPGGGSKIRTGKGIVECGVGQAR